MTRSRAIITLIALALALPSAAFGQGAGDEQYQDPFGDEQAQGNGGGNTRAAQDDGLEDTPPVDDGSTQTTPPAEEETPAEETPPTEADDSALPNTGSDPRLLAFFGLLFLLIGVGLRLRTIDPDAY